MEVEIILDQDANQLQQALEYKIGTRIEPDAVLATLEWLVWGILKKITNCMTLHLHKRRTNSKKNVQIRALCFHNQLLHSIKKKLQHKKTRKCDEIYRRALWHKNAVNKIERKLPNNSGSDLGQLYSMKQIFQKDLNIKNLYQQSIDKDVEKGCLKTFEWIIF